ncbi:serine/threonine-protein phosphatase 4 regulatory subunit 2-A-like [Hypomesus transpacificus]|uniref:serine/threonine-protein phosphatase 4 regulatory subunit 2-A-like n=1 Tax=Hypomesus transpacificus TaxID=137520 RepID=UPI001F082FE0|nr:serine/threonine-protein phosphatase 4 regulatory subunit 2-A-like [Hypomesus transpacificus]
MEIDTVLEAFKDFEKKGERETCPVLDQLLCHVAKTGETMIPWTQFKSYFLFKLERVMDDFQSSTPDQRSPANPNVEYIPFKEMKERILKIVDGYNGIPFTIQRLCELLTEPKKNYTGTDKFLRGVEKNVMVVSCVCPTSEKNGSTSINRMNGVMFPDNSSLYSDRNVNGPGTPRPFSRPKLSISSSLSTNGLPDCSDNKGTSSGQGEKHIGVSSLSEGESPHSSLVKNKHADDEDAMEADGHEVKRLKFDNDEEENEEEERESSCPARPESSTDTPESSTDAEVEQGNPANVVTGEDHMPTSTQTESQDEEEETGDGEAVAAHSQKSDCTSEQSGKNLSLNEQEDGPSGDPVSSSCGDSTTSDQLLPASPSSTAESSAEGATEASSESPETAGEEAMEQD